MSDYPKERRVSQNTTYTSSPLDFCEKCQAYWQANRDSLAFAAASVGIEHGLTTNQALWEWFHDFHHRDHSTGKDAA